MGPALPFVVAVGVLLGMPLAVSQENPADLWTGVQVTPVTIYPGEEGAWEGELLVNVSYALPVGVLASRIEVDLTQHRGEGWGRVTLEPEVLSFDSGPYRPGATYVLESARVRFRATVGEPPADVPWEPLGVKACARNETLASGHCGTTDLALFGPAGEPGDGTYAGYPARAPPLRAETPIPLVVGLAAATIAACLWRRQ